MALWVLFVNMSCVICACSNIHHPNLGKHYVGRGLMKRFDSGEELARELGVPVSKLKDTFNQYIEVASGKKKDPHNKSTRFILVTLLAPPLTSRSLPAQNSFIIITSRWKVLIMLPV